ncbi:MAG: right-handed parallel beta-helix repeat-containing protein [Catenulispora sp.]
MAIQGSSGTTITHSLIEGGQSDSTSPGLSITGSASTGTTVTDTQFQSNGLSAVVMTGGAGHTTLAGDDFWESRGTAIVATGSSGDVITGNTVRYAPQGIVATAGSTNLTIADNIVFDELGPAATGPFPGPMVVVDASSTSGTSIHHNVVDQVRTDDYSAQIAQPATASQVLGQTDLSGEIVATGPAYSWAGTVYQDASALHAKTGQGTADINADPQFAGPSVLTLRATSPAIDSADSSAPGWQSTDYNDAARFHDDQIATTGTGPVPYADRGAVEFQGGPTVVAKVTPVTRPGASGDDYGVQVDLSGSKSPFADIQTYSIGFY